MIYEAHSLHKLHVCHGVITYHKILILVTIQIACR
jgi:hypothetical protein